MVTFTTKSAFIRLAVIPLFCIPAFGQVTKTEDQQLIPIDLNGGGWFGSSVALDGDTAVIGVPRDDVGGTIDSGAAYVFTRSNGDWTEQAKLLASDKASYDNFGVSVALDGNTAVIGADSEGDGGTEGNGAAYVFTRSDGIWTEQAKLLASDKANSDYFGRSVALDGDTAVIGADYVDDSGTMNNGAAYVFTRSGGVWTEQAKLLASDKVTNDHFGRSVALDGETAVIGADYEDAGGNFENGAAYVFTRSGGIWTEQAKLLASDKDSGDNFGFSVALDGDTAVIGAHWEGDGGTMGNGAAYVFTRSGGVWTEQAKLLASDKDSADNFGFSVALDGDTAVIGAHWEDDGGTISNGAAYVFTRSGGVWTEQAKLLASDKANYDNFGDSVALDGDTAVIGASGKNGLSGAAYVFALTPLASDDGPYVLDEGGELVEDVNILDNDSNPGGDPLTPVVVDPPAHASFFQVMPDGTFDYTHDGSETTSDSFTYRASDGVNESEIATVSLEIRPVNDAPKIRLIGESTMTLVGGSVFNDPGATADDAEDGDISDAIVVGGDSVDTNTEGTYIITYNVTDSDGLAAAEVIRTVFVEIDDPPVITLIGPAILVLEVGDTYDEPGATAQDPEDGDLTNQIVIDNPVNTAVPGTYTVTYTVEDSAGNQEQVVRTVIVEAAPVEEPRGTVLGESTWVAGNGHVYVIVELPEASWTDAAADVEALLPGYHLVTVTSAEEEAFIEQLLVDVTGSSGWEWWLGGFQDVEVETDPAAGWKWVTGEPWIYTDWREGEPNDAGGIEDHLALDSGAWNDEGTALGAVRGYIAELGRFDDVPATYWAFDFIESLWQSGITGGCGNNNFCPEAPITRAQMAVFLERAMYGSEFSPLPALGNVFLDVGADDFAASYIEQLYWDGITGGCGNNNFCPEDSVSRAQMAVFLLRAMYGPGYTPPPAVGVFDDVDLAYWAVAWIEQLAAEGVTSGCGGGNYCPDAAVTRAQMAVFIIRAIEPHLPPPPPPR